MFQPPSQSSQINVDIAIVDEDGVVRCYHAVPAVRRTSTKARSAGRVFWTCHLFSEHPQNCKFFKWDEDLPPHHDSPNPTPASSHAHQPTQTQPTTPASQGRFTPRTPTSSRVPVSAAPSSKRALSPDPITPSKRLCFAPGGSQPSPRLDPEMQAARRRRYCELIAAARREPDGESAPSSSTNSTDTAIEEGPAHEKWAEAQQDNPFFVASQTMTPPGSSPQSRFWLSGRREATPSSPSMGREKGKGKEHDLSALTPSQSMAPLIPTPSSSQRTDASDSGKVTADSIAGVLDTLSHIPAYVGKLERRVVALERSNDVKTKHIATLEAQVAKAKQEKAQLEQALKLVVASRGD
ncbi:hypothetical protein BV25DRAFT_1833371 [Artomyces pyxidatus]|uniref:Uncharacterized protein n=1 Tax=Artomyces pyxidatus TaxID=48021 RepID=A0ACB8SGU0_9AGAM|nr:hypothetical protein BV25DRAFT_1833371 [Artomyces pyxidatus]